MTAVGVLCECCEPNAFLTPLEVENRPALSAIAYRIGTYSSFRRTMLERIASTPELIQLTTRSDDDYSITVLDLWAAVADVLTFYQERYANETFLRTATQRVSVIRLAELLGYRLRPGVATVARLAFTVEGGKAVAIPAGVRVQSVSGPPTADAAIPALELSPTSTLPQTFETVEAITADGRLNRLRIFPPVGGPGPLAAGQVLCVLDREEGAALTATLFKRSRVVLFVDGATTGVEEKEVMEVRTEDDRVTLRWTQPILGTGWGSATQAYLFTRTHRLFGHNAPSTFFLLEEDPTSVTGVAWSKEDTPSGYPRSGSVEDNPTSAASYLCLDGRVSGIAVGADLLVADTASGGRKTLVNVTALDQVQDELGGVSETVTRLTVSPAIPDVVDRRSVVVYELAGPRIRFSGRYPERITGTTVLLPGRKLQDDLGEGIEVNRAIQGGAFVPGVVLRPVQIEVGRPVLLSDGEAEPLVASIASGPTISPVSASPGEFCHLVLSLSVEGTPDLATSSAVLLGNVALATHGESVRDEILGNGDASKRFQRFTLKKKPLTYAAAGGAAGAVTSSLRLEVNGTRWTEVPSLYGQEPTARVFTTRTDDEEATTLLFGDGVTGTVLPTGLSNIVATYRSGSGLAGRVDAGMITTPLDRPVGSKDVTNPLPSTGGADSEKTADARRNAPRTVRTFGRAVSLRDFEDLITESGEVAKAQASWVWTGLDRAVFLTVAGQMGGAFTEGDLRRLGDSLRGARDPNHPIFLANHIPVPIVLAATVIVDAAYDSAEVAPAAREAAVATLSFDVLRFAQPIHLSDVVRALQDVAGVVAVDVDELMFKQQAGMTAAQFDDVLTDRGVTRLPDGTPQTVQGHLSILAARTDPDILGVVLPAELAVVESRTQDVQITLSAGELS